MSVPTTWAASSVQTAVGSRFAAWIAKTIGAVAMVSLGAHVQVPVPGTDVPMTLQALSVLLVGFWLHPSQAAVALVAYVGVGTLGLPVFASASRGLFGATGGYLVGFVAASWLVAQLKEANLGRNVFAASVGMAAIFVCGVLWRVSWAIFTGFEGGVWAAATTGVIPFVGKAVVEVCLVVAVASRMTWLRRAVPDRRE